MKTKIINKKGLLIKLFNHINYVLDKYHKNIVINNILSIIFFTLFIFILLGVPAYISFEILKLPDAIGGILIFLYMLTIFYISGQLKNTYYFIDESGKKIHKKGFYRIETKFSKEFDNEDFVNYMNEGYVLVSRITGIFSTKEMYNILDKSKKINFDNWYDSRGELVENIIQASAITEQLKEYNELKKYNERDEYNQITSEVIEVLIILEKKGIINKEQRLKYKSRLGESVLNVKANMVIEILKLALINKLYDQIIGFSEYIEQNNLEVYELMITDYFILIGASYQEVGSLELADKHFDKYILSIENERKINENYEDKIRKQFNDNDEILNKQGMVGLMFVIASLEELGLSYKLPKTGSVQSKQTKKEKF